MNVSVKTAYDKLLTVCSAIDSEIPKFNTSDSVNKFLAEDIYYFIKFISRSDADSRYAYFNQVYQDDMYNVDDLDQESEVSLPLTFRILCATDNSSEKFRKTPLAGFYISFVSELGKYYILSKFDKKDIDSDKFLEYMNILKNYMKKQNSVVSNSDKQHDFAEGKKYFATGSRQETAAKQRKVNADEPETSETER